MRRRTKWLVAAALGLGILVAAGMAASFTLGRDPAGLVLFDVRLTKTANRYLRDNGTTYMLGEEKFTSRKSREAALAEAEYRRKAET